MIRVTLPYHLSTLAQVGKEVQIQVGEPTTVGALLEALEAQYPVLRGTLRDQLTLQRRPFIRYFACGEDLSLEPVSISLPGPVVAGAEPFRIVGAMAGG